MRRTGVSGYESLTMDPDAACRRRLRAVPFELYHSVSHRILLSLVVFITVSSPQQSIVVAYKHSMRRSGLAEDKRQRNAIVVTRGSGWEGCIRRPPAVTRRIEGVFSSSAVVRLFLPATITPPSGGVTPAAG
ncbi:hypothetical protein MRX96_029601 [Rhipicephalus microplus]